MVTGIKEDLKNSILPIILQHVSSETSLVFLFGSFASGAEHPHSDIDIGFFGEEALSMTTLREIRDELDEMVRTLRKVDFVDFSGVQDRVFMKEALEGSIIWYQGKGCRTSLESLKMHLAG